MRHQSGWIQRLLQTGKDHGGTLSMLVLAAGLLSLPALAFGRMPHRQLRPSIVTFPTSAAVT